MKNLVLVLIVAAPLVTACRTTRAQVPIERPALDVPPVPPRVVEPAPIETPMPDPVPDLPATPAAPPRPRPQARDSVPREQPKPEVKPEAPPAEPAAPQAPPPATVPPLRTAGTADGAQAERDIRAMLARTQALLDRVDYKGSPEVRQKAYDEAKLFMRNAEDALKDSNFVFARKLAEKAETMAKELQGR